MQVQRSKAYPSIDLGAAMERMNKFNNNLGAVGYHGRDEVAKGIGYNGISGSSGRTIGALVHYGLLERNKDQYRLSEIAKTILFSHESEHEKQQAIREAALQPALFRELTEQYAGNELPSLLSNILTSDRYGINPKVKDEVAEVYRATLAYAGLLDGNKVRALDDSPVPTASDFDEATDEPFAGTARPAMPMPLDRPQQSQSDDLNRIEIVLREGVKAGIYAPYDLTDQEKTKLKTIIDLL